MLVYKQAETDAELLGILELQRENHFSSLDPERMRTQGFLTARHDFPLLRRMNAPYGHTIAVEDGRLAGYALTMERIFQEEIPVLLPMFREIDSLAFRGGALRDADYLVMGQVCVAAAYRGQGVFSGLYAAMRGSLSGRFRYLVTEVSLKNARSLRAHAKVGFQGIRDYSCPMDPEVWRILLWDWR